MSRNPKLSKTERTIRKDLDTAQVVFNFLDSHSIKERVQRKLDYMELTKEVLQLDETAIRAPRHDLNQIDLFRFGIGDFSAQVSVEVHPTPLAPVGRYMVDVNLKLHQMDMTDYELMLRILKRIGSFRKFKETRILKAKEEE